MVDDDKHDCPKIGCPKRLEMGILACGPHWFALPPELRKQISTAWRNGELRTHLELREEAVRILNA